MDKRGKKRIEIKNDFETGNVYYSMRKKMRSRQRKRRRKKMRRRQIKRKRKKMRSRQRKRRRKKMRRRQRKRKGEGRGE